MLEIRPFETGRPPEVGSRYQVRQPKLAPAILTIVEWKPLLGFVWESESTGLRAAASHWIEKKRASRCEVTLGVCYTGIFSPIVAAMAGKLTSEFLRQEAFGLKEAAEDK